MTQHEHNVGRDAQEWEAHMKKRVQELKQQRDELQSRVDFLNDQNSAQQEQNDSLAALNAEFLSELSEYRAIRDRLAAQDKAGTLPDDYSIYIGLLENRLSEQRNLNSAMEQQRDELLAAAEIFRDSVLHQRHSMADNGMTNDQVNDVLGLFDDTLGEAIAKAGVK